MIKAVLFDLDGTLYDRDTVAEQIFALQYRAFAAELASVGRERFLRDVHAMDEHGHGDKDAGYRRLVEAWRLDAPLAERLNAHFWATYDGLCTLPDDTRVTLRELRRRGLVLGIVTNGESARQRKKIDTLGLAGAFDVVLVSGEEGVRKPDRVIFERALERCAVRADEAMFVGDHPVADIMGAHAAGLKAVWKRVPYWQPVVLTALVVERLSEVIGLASAP